MELYKTIRARRMALQMTQQELAARLGYKSTSTIAKIEAGVNDIPQAKIIAFANALATTPGALLGLGNERIVSSIFRKFVFHSAAGSYPASV